MTRILVVKLLRDIRIALILIAVLLGAFQLLWYNVTNRILGQLAPFFNALAGFAGLNEKAVEAQVFSGPGKIVRTLIGGEQIDLNGVMDVLSIGYVHPTVVTIFCLWAVGRAAGAIAGELDRGTMELLMAQPFARSRLIFAHLCVDLITIPVLCLSLWAGTSLGAWLVGPVKIEKPDLKLPSRPPGGGMELWKVGPLKLSVEGSLEPGQTPSTPAAESRLRDRLEVRVLAFGPALPVVAGLLFALSGMTLWLSSAGRSRLRVLGFAVLMVLLQFLINLIGQLWDLVAFLRPFTVFYYYQPQKVILGQGWDVDFAVWNGGSPLVHVNMLLVLVGVGILGYGMALRTFIRRDLPAPL